MASESPLKYTPVEEIELIHDALKAEFLTGKTKPVKFRKQQLLKLAYMIKDNIPKFEAALTADLGRPHLENHLLEISGCIRDVVYSYKNVEKWAKTEKAPFSLNFSAQNPVVRKEPKGLVLIISPFNYPFWLCLSPLTGAISAGCAAVIKPSELAPHVSAVLAELVDKYLDTSLYRVINGAVPETTRLLELRWDHIVYTGNGQVARIVAAAAVKHLTPITLELGGKSPVFVDPNCDLKLAARRIAWGKFSNCGQTCIAPDYVIIPEEAQDKFINAFKEVYNTFYPKGPHNSGSLSRIVNARHYARIHKLLINTHGAFVLGGPQECVESELYIAPSLIRDVRGDDALMSEEIFGPVLPILPVKDLDEAIAYVRARDNPLVLYVFTQDKKFRDQVFNNTLSGACVANDTLTHIAVVGLPVTGIGESGYGNMTDKFSFDTFTHLRSSIDSPKWFDKILGSRYPPYTPEKLKTLSKLLYRTVPPRDDADDLGVLQRVRRSFPLSLLVAVAATAVGFLYMPIGKVLSLFGAKAGGN